MPDLDAIEWKPLDATSLPGLYESIKLDGEGAQSVLNVYYYFSDDGSYSGAALVDDAEGIGFQTLSGEWKLTQGQIDLGNGRRLRALQSGELLSLSSPHGTAVLRRRVLD